MLRINNLSKTYPSGVKALQNVNLEMPLGIFGLLGPNGAGKSTLMRIIATLQEADQGQVKFAGLNVLTQKQALRKLLGYLPQQFGTYPRVSAHALLNHLAVLKGITNKQERKKIVTALLKKTNLEHVKNQNLKEYSGGMKQRFGIAQALLNSPKLLILDEPTAGLDPLEKRRFYNILSEISENTLVILSTHIVNDIKELCTRMAIINEGRVLASGDPLEMIQQLEEKMFEKTIQKNELCQYQAQYDIISDRLFLGQLIIRVLSEAIPKDGFEKVQPTLEDVYFSQLKMASKN